MNKYKFSFRRVSCDYIVIEAENEDAALYIAMAKFFQLPLESVNEGTIYEADDDNDQALMDYDECRGWESAN